VRNFPCGESSHEVRPVTASDGYLLKYYVWEREDTGDVIFFMPGDMSHSIWMRHILERLYERGMKVVALERRGMGINRRDIGDAPSVQQLMDDTETIIGEEAGGRRTHLVGWSFGSIIGMNYYSFSTREISSLTLITPYLFLQNHFVERSVRDKTRPDRNSCQVEIPLTLKEEDFTKSGCLQNFILRDPWRLRAITPRYYEIQRRMMKYAWYMLAGIRVFLPAKVILATKDRVVDNSRTEEAFSLMHGCEIKYINAEHGIQFEKSEELEKNVASWIQEKIRNMF
jgi:alpha-beta hydrolase superfamily lysophospholipase